MRELLRSLPLVVAVLAIPIVPFVLLGGSIDVWFERWRSSAADPLTAAALVVGLLFTDILLPIPSSLISTFGGSQLGWWLGTLASWCGMSAGAILGFALARWLGPGFARRMSRPASLAHMGQLADRYGASAIVLTRGLPILAEASVLLLGMQRMAWSRFLPPLLLANLGLSLVYSICGAIAAQHNSTPLALAVSILLPVLAALVVQRRMTSLPPSPP